MATKKATGSKKPTNRKKKVEFKPLTVPAPVLTNHIVLVLDSSGSMQSLRDTTIEAFNQNVENIKAEAKKSGQNTTVTLVVLGETNSNPVYFGGVRTTKSFYSNYTTNTPNYPQVNLRYLRQPVEKLQPLTRATYDPSGSTPLYDAVGLAIEEMLKSPDVNDPNTSFVFFVQTDGRDEYSSLYTPGTMMNRIKAQQATDRWSFGFLLPKGYGASFVSLGVPAGNVSEWEATQQGATDAAVTTRSAISGYYASRAMGQTSSANLFTVNAAGITKTTLKKELVDISKIVKEWTVDKDGESIETFVKRKNKGAFVIGAGFYELRKKEVIQANKQILVKDRTTGKIYGGPEARELLGLPTHEIKVVPGTFGNYEVYVQSTSHNRKLPLSTKLLYRTDITTDLRHTWVDPTKASTVTP